MKKTFLLILALLFLTGCSAQAAEPVLPAASTPSRSPSLPVTKRPTSTATLNPTSTQEPTQTPDAGLATRVAALDSCRGNSQESIDGFIDQAYSANRVWSATVCQDEGIYTRVAKLGKDKVWKIPALDTDPSTSGPDWVWEPYLWSLDEKYLYLRPRYFGSIDSPWLIYSSGFGLAQFDLSTGVLNTWLPPEHEGHAFALSEEGRLFASLSDIPRTIDVRDVKTGERRQLSFKEKYRILQMRWTPDGARLIILTEEASDDPAQGGFSIFEYSLEQDELSKLVDKNSLNSIYSPDEFEEPRIYISNLSNDVLSLSDILEGGFFQIDLATGVVSQTDELGTPIASP